MGFVQQQKDSEQRLTGVVVPVGALRGAQSIGVGEFPDLVEFASLCSKMDIGLIQLLPVNDTGYESSPYSALTAFALHPLYLRIGDLPEAASFTEQIEEIRKNFDREGRFPYQQILRAKMALLRNIYAAREKEIGNKAKPGGSLDAWITNNPWVKEYAVYRRLKEANGEKSWKEWTSHRTVSEGDIESLWNDKKLQKEHIFWVWVQEALDKQFSLAATTIKKEGILLEGDIPILMNEDSCDVWAHAQYFHQNLSAGAPPDMYSPQGQNWGFPIYNWEAQAADNYSWWRRRLKEAEKYYQAYRIDHVLGFFRIWASPREDNTAILGRYIPSTPITYQDLQALGFDHGRIQWVSRPHIPTKEVWKALENMRDENGNSDYGAMAAEAERIFVTALNRLNNEELWLFKDSIRGEKDIEALGLHPAGTAYLLQAWGNRIFLEYEKDRYAPLWFYQNSRAYANLNDMERVKLEGLLAQRAKDSEQKWEAEGRKLLKILTESSSMLPCAEDLGAVPACVPKVLKELNILGLRVIRWFREWDKENQPYIPFEDYPELSVCTPSVHDSSTLREWWDREAVQDIFSNFIGEPSLPQIYNQGVAKLILYKVATAVSRFRVFQIQDLLHLSQRWYNKDPATERINVPGTINEFNWTYRLPASIREIAKDVELIKAVEALAALQPAQRKR